MARRQKKRRNVKFGNRKHSTRGILSTVMAAFSIILLCVLVIVSYKMRGNGGIYLGSVGIAAFLLNLVGVSTAIKSFKEKEREYLFSKIGIIINFIMVLSWAGIYILGM